MVSTTFDFRKTDLDIVKFFNKKKTKIATYQQITAEDGLKKFTMLMVSCLSVLLVAASVLHAAPADLPKTGQTTVYATGDDGGLQTGVAWPTPRFTNSDGTTPISGSIVVDQLTGLMWTKDGNAPGPAACSPGAAKTWQGALDYVACLNTNSYLGYTDWRLPNRKDMRSLVNYGQANSATWLNGQGFTNAQANNYWSSTTYANSTGSAWIVPVNDGYVYNDNTNFNYYVWPVRAGQSGSFAYLNISKSGTGSGAVTVDKGAIIWSGSAGVASYGSAMSVNISAVADSGSTFAGWSGDCSGTGTCTVTMDAAKNVTATFSLAYTVTYNGNGNTGGTAPTDGSSPYASGATVTVLGNTGSLVKTGYTFAGWNTLADGMGTAYAATDTFNIAANTTLYAQWTINNYTVSFTSNGGSAVTSQSVTYNTTATEPAAPTKTGYTFGGWYSDSGLTTAFVFSTAITADTTLYAKWTINNYTLTYTAGANGSITGTSPQSINHGSNGSAVTAVPDTGYQFVKWSDDSTVNPRTDASVTANLSVTANFIATDDDLDGVPNISDAFPTNPAASVDTDGDGYPDSWNPGKSAADSTTGLTKLDAFPTNASYALDDDNDGLPDEWEIANYGDTTGLPSDDTDGDGLTSLEEFRLGTSPTTDNATLTDTDGDGIPDIVETAWGLDPNNPADASADPDGDGFTNIMEYFLATPPNVHNSLLADTDGDGIPDIVEAANGTDPAVNDASADPDGDGLTNLLEYYLASGANQDNRLMADTDNDGIPDLVEIAAGLDPLADNSSTDRDADGISDVTEYRNGTCNIVNTALVDTDGDGLPDIWERAHGLDPATSNIGVDSDNDGIDDLAEYDLGLSPIDANQPPIKVTVTTQNGSKFATSGTVTISVTPTTDPEGMSLTYTATLYEGMTATGTALEAIPFNPATGYIPGVTLGSDKIYTVVIKASDGYADSPVTLKHFAYTDGTIAGDVNLDGMVDGYDLILMAVTFGKGVNDTQSNPFADLDNNGTIDGDDLMTLGTNFGKYR